VDGLDLSDIVAPYQGEERGQPPYNPRMMSKLLICAYCVDVPSSRKIEQKSHEDVAFRVVAANQHPDHDTICEFGSRHLKALAGLFVEVLTLCRQAGLVKLGHVALDGTKVKANTSKHKAMSYARMCEAEPELRRQLEHLLGKARQVDRQEDRLYGKDKRGDELPQEVRFRAGRLKNIRQAKEALEQQAKERALSEGKIDEDGNPVKRKTGRKPKHPPGVPKGSAQRNFTDPENRIMKESATKAFVQGLSASGGQDASEVKDQARQA